MLAANESSLLDRAVSALQEATNGRLSVERLGESAVRAVAGKDDVTIQIAGGGARHHFLCEIKTKLDPRAVAAAAATLESIRRATKAEVVLVTEYVSQGLATELIDQGVQFIDAVGNAYLDAGGLFILITAKRRRRSQRQGRLDTKTTWSRGVNVNSCVRRITRRPALTAPPALRL